MLKNKYGELRCGWVVAASIIWLIFVQLIVSLIIQQALAIIIGTEDMQRFMLIAVPLIRIVPMIVSIAGILLLFHILYKRPISELGLYRRRWLRELLFGCLFGIASMTLTFAALVLSGQARIADIDLSNFAVSSFWVSLVSFILVGFNEEILTRGFMMTAFKTSRSKILIFTGSALIFSLLHLMNPNVTVLSLVNIFLVGILFACLFVRTGKLWAPIGYHITWNFFQGNVFGINVSGGQSGASLISTELTGADWFTGGAFGAEGGIVVTAVVLLGIAFTYFTVKKPDGPMWTFENGLPLTRDRKEDTGNEV